MERDPSKKLLGMNPAQLGAVAAAVGLKPFAARQIASWLYVKRAVSIDAMTDLSKSARARMEAD